MICPKCAEPNLVVVSLWNGVELFRCMNCNHSNIEFLDDRSLDIFDDFLYWTFDEVVKVNEKRRKGVF